MTKTKAIEYIKKQLDLIPAIQDKGKDSFEFKKWKKDSETIIGKIFINDSNRLDEFKKIRFNLGLTTGSTTNQDFHEAFLFGLDSCKALFASMQDEINEFGLGDNEDQVDLVPILQVQKLCSRFHIICRQLSQRYNNRSTFNINDEYDVQDLLHALLKLDFDDIRPEEYAPSYAGSASRMDFLLKKEQIVIEVKMTRKGLSNKEVGEQLLIDIQRYHNHPDCKCLVCFVYDPAGWIKNPVGIENDLTKDYDSMPVITIISPK